MNINFVTLADERMASYRYHNEIPARELEKLGHKTIISKMPSLNADVYVFSKHFNYGDYWYMCGVMSQGKKAAFHCCDNHFDTIHRDHYLRMLQMADTILASTPEMASFIKQETNREAAVIPDTYEFDEKEPVFNPGGKLKVLWYGHPSNLDSLMDILSDLSGYELVLCTEPMGIPLKLKNIPVTVYSKANLEAAFKWCDVVIIPSRTEERKLVKSHNRLVEAVRRGKFVVASPLPAYQEYSGWMYIGDIREGLEWVEKNKNEIWHRIIYAQEYIKENYNPAKIGELWQKALS